MSLFIPPGGAMQFELTGMDGAVWVSGKFPRQASGECACTEGYLVIEESTPDHIEWELLTSNGGGILVCTCHGRIIE